MDRGIGNKIIHSLYEQMTEYIELLLEVGGEMSNILIDLQVEQAHNKQTFEKQTIYNCTTIAELRTKKQLIDVLLKN